MTKPETAIQIAKLVFGLIAFGLIIKVIVLLQEISSKL